MRTLNRANCRIYLRGQIYSKNVKYDFGHAYMDIRVKVRSDRITRNGANKSFYVFCVLDSRVVDMQYFQKATNTFRKGDFVEIVGSFSIGTKKDGKTLMPFVTIIQMAYQGTRRKTAHVPERKAKKYRLEERIRQTFHYDDMEIEISDESVEGKTLSDSIGDINLPKY